MAVSYIAPLTRGWDRMTRILFTPFDLVRWLTIGFAAWLASLVDAGSWGGWQFNFGDHSGRELVHEATNLSERVITHAIAIPFIVVVIMMAIAVIAALLWISSHAKLVFLDNVVRGRAGIAEPWRRTSHLGNSLFLWRLGFAAAVTVGIGLVVVALVVPAAGASWSDPVGALSIAALLAAGLFALLIGVAAALVSLFLDSFVVPIMYRYDLSAIAAWRALLPWLSARGSSFLLYALFVLVLYIAFSLARVLVCAFSCCVLGLPYLSTVALLPLLVTYRAFSVEFLTQLHPDFDLFVRSESRPQS
jgi:hypothetical protein